MISLLRISSSERLLIILFYNDLLNLAIQFNFTLSYYIYTLLSLLFSIKCAHIYATSGNHLSIYKIIDMLYTNRIYLTLIHIKRNGAAKIIYFHARRNMFRRNKMSKEHNVRVFILKSSIFYHYERLLRNCTGLTDTGFLIEKEAIRAGRAWDLPKENCQSRPLIGGIMIQMVPLSAFTRY